ncbi:DUF4339 domain-containing protein [Verrucomicrobiales bacterium BCK34]|nr:DUF4339 domain-containing protein [Verrucomicrobiales bacterium BCK34]
MSDAIWFYEDNGERKGPVTAEFLVGLKTSGSITAETLVWRDGFADWLPFRESELFEPDSQSGSTPAPPSLPPALRAKPAFVAREISFNPGYEFGIRKTLGQGWRLMVSDFWPFVGFFTIMYLIVGIVSQFGVTVFFLMYPLMAGYFWWALLRKRGEPAEMDLLFEGFRRQFGPLALANLAVVGVAMLLLMVLGIACFGGCAGIAAVIDGASGVDPENPVMVVLGVLLGALLIFVAMVPLILAQQIGCFVMLLIMEGNLNAGEAISLGWQATKRHWFKFVLLSLVAMVLSLLGMLALYVGVFVSCAWLALGQIYIYEEAFGDAGA